MSTRTLVGALVGTAITAPRKTTVNGAMQLTATTYTFGFTFGDVALGNEQRGSVPYTREQLTGPGARMVLGS